MHPRNPHQGRYPLAQMLEVSPQLRTHVMDNRQGEATIDFDNPAAVRSLNQALLLYYYGIKSWEFPPHFLCPPIPGRADYLHYLADLFPGAKKLRGLDIGVGASCIYPLLGHKSYGWTFVGSDINREALKVANDIVISNQLAEVIELRWQASSDKIFSGIIQADEHFDFSMCNPPFHPTPAEARAGTERKRKNLGLKQNGKLNFGGISHELWCRGGERDFVSQMIQESRQRPQAIVWYTTLISKQDNLKYLQQKLKAVDCSQVKVIDMAQGQKKSRILAWSFI